MEHSEQVDFKRHRKTEVVLSGDTVRVFMTKLVLKITKRVIKSFSTFCDIFPLRELKK